MTDRKLSALTQAPAATKADISALYLAGYDLTRTAGDRNVKAAATDLLALAGGGGGLNVAVINQINASPYATVDTAVFTPAAGNDVIIYTLLVQAATLASPTYNFQLYGGNPASGGKLVFDWGAAHAVGNTYPSVGDDGSATATIENPLYVPLSFSGSAQIWLRIISTYANVTTVGAQIVVAEFAGHGAALPVWQDPPAYTGPLMDVVYVGPTRQFIEPRFGMQAINDGGTMYIDPGEYYYPFGISGDPGVIHHPLFGDNPNSPSGAARFVRGITIIGSGTYTGNATVLNGRGGYGLQPSHPYRLTRGNAFIYTNCPLTISDCRFIFCGGDDQNSDGEAAIWAGSFPENDTVHIIRCAFDGNEDSIFTPHWYDLAAETGAIDPVTGQIDGTGPGVNVNILIENCDFGYTLPNGGGGDGGSSDIYIECRTLTVNNSHFYGDLCPWPLAMRQANTVYSDYAHNLVNPPTSGNCVKSRCCATTINNCWIRNQSGKMIDICEGGQVLVTDTVLCSLDGVTSLILGYATEGTHRATLVSSPVFRDCTLYGLRHNAVLWIAFSGLFFDFQNLTQYWNSLDAVFVPNFDNSGYIANQAAAPNLILAPPPGTVTVPNPPAPPPASLKPGETAVYPPLYG